MGEYLDQPAKLSPELLEEKSHVGITPDNYQILPPSSNHIYRSINIPSGSGSNGVLSIATSLGRSNGCQTISHGKHSTITSCPHFSKRADSPNVAMSHICVKSGDFMLFLTRVPTCSDLGSEQVGRWLTLGDKGLFALDLRHTAIDCEIHTGNI